MGRDWGLGRGGWYWGSRGYRGSDGGGCAGRSLRAASRPSLRRHWNLEWGADGRILRTREHDVDVYPAVLSAVFRRVVGIQGRVLAAIPERQPVLRELVNVDQV